MLSRIFLLTACFMAVTFTLDARPADLTDKDVTEKAHEIMQAHVKYKRLSPFLMQRALSNYISELDPSKTYLIADEVAPWDELDEEELQRLVEEFEVHNFTTFENIHALMNQAIERRHAFEDTLEEEDFEEEVDPSTLKDLEWAESEDELLERITLLRAMQRQVAQKLEEEKEQTLLKRFAKNQKTYEEHVLPEDPEERAKEIRTRILKAVAGALDGQTAYFTPQEATDFLINVQQRLFGIGVRLRDDLTGFTAVEIVKGGPADKQKTIEEGDRIIAVDGEPVVGMDVFEVVGLIRGPADTSVTLTVLRKKEGSTETDRLDVEVIRGEVVLTETRLETDTFPFADGVIAHLHLHSFYQDPRASSALDLKRAIHTISEEHKIKGVLLDLRYNLGGLINQAVDVTGLFISKGIVVSIKNHANKLQHLRDIDGEQEWYGPVVVLVNRLSASASEIVAQTLQDYGRAIIVGDENSFGKGTFQTLTLSATKQSDVNPKGEYKVTQGLYYTVSGKSPQLQGVAVDITVPGSLTAMEVGEKYSDYPLENESIAPHFIDDLADIPLLHRERIARSYHKNLQPILSSYTSHLDRLRDNSAARVEGNALYQHFLEEVNLGEDMDKTKLQPYADYDFQLQEALAILQDLIVISKQPTKQ